MRSIAAKFLISVAVLGTLFAAFLHYRSYTTARRHMLELTDRQAALALQFNLAVREYVAEQIRPLVADLVGPDDFIPEAMSTSFVSRSVFEKVQAQFPDIIVKFSSDHPRNPVNAASPDELRFIKYFNAHPEVDTLTATLAIDGRQYKAYFSAKRVEPSCLRCHGDPADAPAALIARYGDQASFHRELGKVVALDTVAIPVDRVTAALANETTRQSAITLGGLAVLLGGIGLVFRSVISSRLAHMAAHFRRSATQAEGAPLQTVPVQGRDEIAGLAASFNTLAARLQATHASLEQRVVERTQALANANEELKRQIAEREQTERQLQKAKAAAEAAVEARSEFLANVSHEVRTPMTAILGFTDLLLDADDLSPDHTDAIRTIQRNGQYLLSVLNDILDLSKIEAGRMSVERLPCALGDLVREVVALARVPADSKGLPLHVEYSGPIPATICTDPTRLRQILFNVLGNAVKFTQQGEVRLSVRLRDDGPEPLIQFDVADTGVGMTAEQATRLFQPFTQADMSTTRRFGGTGLGLTISRRLARTLGGDVTVVETQPDVGTLLRVTIAAGPLDGVWMTVAPPTEAAAPTVAAHGAAPHDPAALAGCRVLLAEDGPDNQRLVCRILERAGARVTVVESGETAVKAALAADSSARPFDVILMDMQMPLMDGYEATGLLRARGYRGAIVALTANAMTSDRRRCLDCGCDDYLSKPLDRAALVETIRRFGATCRAAEGPARPAANVPPA